MRRRFGHIILRCQPRSHFHLWQSLLKEAESPQNALLCWSFTSAIKSFRYVLLRSSVKLLQKTNKNVAEDGDWNFQNGHSQCTFNAIELLTSTACSFILCWIFASMMWRPMSPCVLTLHFHVLAQELNCCSVVAKVSVYLSTSRTIVTGAPALHEVNGLGQMNSTTRSSQGCDARSSQ